jgi:hypothetical protein
VRGFCAQFGDKLLCLLTFTSLSLSSLCENGRENKSAVGTRLSSHWSDFQSRTTILLWSVENCELVQSRWYPRAPAEIPTSLLVYRPYLWWTYSISRLSEVSSNKSSGLAPLISFSSALIPGSPGTIQKFGH